MTVASGISVRAATSSDWPDIRRICCETGNNGNPIDSNRCAFFSDFWVGPYQTILPEWTFVAEREGRVIGYLTGCPDTRKFKPLRFVRNRIPLLLKLFVGLHAWTPDAQRFIRRLLRLDRGPESLFSPKLHELLNTEFPAHLHVNVSAEARGGTGRKLMDAYLDALRRSNVTGVHLFCGVTPAGFYQRLGFRELEVIQFRASPESEPFSVHCYGLRIVADPRRPSR